MRVLYRFFLYLMGVAIPVFLAACYGAPYGFSKRGKVVDAVSKEGINGIKVTCLENGQDWNHSWSYTDGTFHVYYDIPCDQLLFEDEDGPENGGFYQRRAIPFDEDCEEITVELAHAERE